MRGTHRFRKYGPKAYPVAHTYAHHRLQEPDIATIDVAATKPSLQVEPIPISMDTSLDERNNPGKRLLERVPADTWQTSKRWKAHYDQDPEQIPIRATPNEEARYPADMVQQMRYLARFYASGN